MRYLFIRSIDRQLQSRIFRKFFCKLSALSTEKFRFQKEGEERKSPLVTFFLRFTFTHNQCGYLVNISIKKDYVDYILFSGEQSPFKLADSFRLLSNIVTRIDQRIVIEGTYISHASVRLDSKLYLSIN